MQCCPSAILHLQTSVSLKQAMMLGTVGLVYSCSGLHPSCRFAESPSPSWIGVICLFADTQRSIVLVFVYLHYNQLQVIFKSKLDFAVARKAVAAYFNRPQRCGQLRSFQDLYLSCNSCPSVGQAKPKRYAAMGKHTLLGTSLPSSASTDFHCSMQASMIFSPLVLHSSH